ncbi:hypothetical protein [Microseira wollei]|uniref:DUF2335 domain-containing protein n=1 Tax=Microseira wollei NIES-4236 TaxID=2530354 RepID=A0AAV3XMM0_9CYAN|nr:hypothetical protein [Microseira wollei]GET43145.1 hypothetical protein MiSe_79660 [Microseira wollei NIES-4236]
MNNNDSIEKNQSTPLNLPTKSGKGEVRPLKDALLRLSVSPIKADREAISRIERETGKDILALLRELDSADLTLKAIEEKPAPQKSQIKRRVGWGFFCGSLVGIAALFMVSPQQLPVAIALGIMLGISLPISRR